ncbi:Oligopeptide ABC transporter, periplasmic oligopeptide-binding protein OppA [Lachnospiraceae bacterium TWA4]|nr:Oligopeptide ABC transporter, periplasmic oligopeptide-binding protein OppA [Lachnospiraceae bacterium TWA4]
MKKKILAFTMAGLMALSTFGCSGSTSKATNSITAEVTTISVMNPLKMTYNTEFSVARHCWDGLVKFDGDNKIIPAAAESWTPSDDGMKWTFKIRKGCKWVDNTGKEVADVTANDFVFGFKELMNPTNAAEYSSFALVFKNAQKYYDFVSGTSKEEVKFEDVGIKALDEYTLELELEDYLPYFEKYMKFEVLAPVNQEFYEKVGAEKYGTSPDTLLFNGPFYMSDWVTEDSVTVKKNPSWRDASNVSLEEIVFKKFVDANTKLNAYQGGELDIMDATGEQVSQLKDEGVEIHSYSGGYSYYAWMNTTDSSDFRSVNLRHAVSAALDRETIINTVYKNNNQVPPCYTYGIAGVNTDTFADAVVKELGGPLYSGSADVESAKKYLDAALKDLGYTDPSQIKLKIMTSESSQNEQLSQVIMEQIKKNLGITIENETLTITAWRERRNQLKFDFCVGGWGPDYDDPLTDLEVFEGSNGNNHTGYNNKEYNDLIAATKTEKDPVAREKIFIQCEQKLAEDLPLIPLYWRMEDFVVSKKVKEGYIRKPFQGYNLIYTKLAE